MASADPQRGPVPLDRRFTPIAPRRKGDDDEELRLVDEMLGRGNAIGWPKLLERYRSVVLAEAGAGKTFEMLQQARLLADAGSPAFFVRLEDLASERTPIRFEIGSALDFSGWLAGETAAWFFLDSIDEARLQGPRDFERAVRHFADQIRGAEHRVHIILSARPYAWRAVSDPAMIALYLGVPQDAVETAAVAGEASGDKDGEEDKRSLGLFRLAPLRTADVRLFAAHRATPEIDGFLQAVERRGLGSLAERPFDLDDLLDLWSKHRRLGSRLEVLQHGIDVRLAEIDEDRAVREPLALERARDGARLLAAAVILTGQAGIRVPDGLRHREGIAAETLLVGWSADDIRALLGRAIFNDILFGMVRFRHREVRDLLAAEWLLGLVRDRGGRRQVEALIFRERYGEAVIAPRLRSLLPWLMLWDRPIAERLLVEAADIAIEDGDPAQLLLADRQRILRHIVRSIVEEQGQGAHNSEIGRFAAPDLEPDVLALIEEHIDHDDAIFFLGRMAWQGEMGGCTEALFPVAIDAGRNRYSRIAATRQIAAVGGAEARGRLWDNLNGQIDLPEDRPNDLSALPQDLLIELLDGALPDADTVERLLASLERIDAIERSRAPELTEAIERLSEQLDAGDDAARAALVRLVQGLAALLDRAPYVRDRDQRVSERYQKLLGPAGLAVELLIRRRAPQALEPAALRILAQVPVLRAWQHRGDRETRKILGELVAEWPALNDALYWSVVGAERARRDEPLTDEVSFSWGPRLWHFGAADFPRIVGWIENRPLLDDRLVALARAWRLYHEADKPDGWFAMLEQAVAATPALAAQLARYATPAPVEQFERWAREDRDFKAEMAQREQDEADRIAQWIAAARSDPSQLLIFPAPGLLAPLHFALSSIAQNRSGGGERGMAGWQLLAEEGGEAVALAYRDAARQHWRDYRPALASEGDYSRSLPHELLFALAGLDIEAEAEGFPSGLTETEAVHAFRYLTWGAGQFPPWVERLLRAFPDAGLASIAAETLWELEQSSLEPIHYILHDILYHAPWVHRGLAPILLGWLEEHDPTPRDYLRWCLAILVKGGVEVQRLAALAAKKLASGRRPGHVPTWFALWVDSDPAQALPSLDRHLASLPARDASAEAQAFIVALSGGRHGSAASIGRYREAGHLARLYLLMHRHIPSASDIQRAGTGVYSPTLRDDAQEARNHLFELLRQIPGKTTYVELMHLAAVHPEADLRHWMAVRARERAIADADLEAMTDEQLRDFAASLDFAPANHRQLHDLAVDRLLDFKAWLEDGHDSLAETYRRVGSETEMRLVVAHWLNAHSHGRFTCPQEAELANAQRPDISIERPGIVAVPIELKLLDANWTGPKLCERLRHQLAGGYLRDHAAGCGIFLLIWQGRGGVAKSWRIQGQRVGLADLEAALQVYWQSIAANHPGVEAIRVLVVDLTARGSRAGESAA